MISNFAGKTAVLTGAGSGFGLELARLAADRGMNLVLVDVQADALARAEAELAPVCAAQGRTVMARRVDVSNAQAMEALAAEVVQQLGAPHVVFNNAGVGSGGLVWENTVADWEWVLGVNLWGVIHGVRCFTPHMLAAAQADPQWQGHIVNTASMAGLLNAPLMGVYNVSKHAVVSLTETLYQDLALVTSQIGASVLCPFFVATGIADSHRNKPGAMADEQPTPSQLVNQAMTTKAVSSGKVTAAEVAARVMDAMETNRFYIYSHPGAVADNVGHRTSAILQGHNPPDPFAERPDVGAKLRTALAQG
jgi:NAD(P)-dependent dehydrogenase (short-subunit alcohol dehydrogenase family)